MLSPLIREALVRLRGRLEARFPGRVRSVCLFGSWARGEATEHSDVDLAVVIDGLSLAEWRETLSIGAQLQLEMEFCFSPFVVSSERFEQLKQGGGIAADIEREGIAP